MSQKYQYLFNFNHNIVRKKISCEMGLKKSSIGCKLKKRLGPNHKMGSNLLMGEKLNKIFLSVIVLILEPSLFFFNQSINPTSNFVLWKVISVRTRLKIIKGGNTILQVKFIFEFYRSILETHIYKYFATKCLHTYDQRVTLS